MQAMIKASLALSGWLAAALAVAAVPVNPADSYRLSAESGTEIATPALPDLSGYTVAALEAKLQRQPAGRAVVKEMLHEPALQAFIGGNEHLREWVVRQKRMPRAIFIEQGYLNGAELARQLPGSVFAETAPGVYLARLPIVVRPGATLHLDRATRELRLSQEAGAFLVNDGRLFITGSQVSGWREQGGTPAAWRSAREFRPFIVAWGGSETYVADSVIRSLGYAAAKSYGFSLASVSPRMPGGRGWVLDSRFIDLWYGFYSDQGEDLVLRGNTYQDCLAYGIAAHDRSRRLIIAENEVFGTRLHHGIDMSRGVGDSWIVNNRSHHNQQSGIVLDHGSANNRLVFNEAYKNQADGIVLAESSHNLLWQNRSTSNARHGIRVRNSEEIGLQDNLLAANGRSGIYGHAQALAGGRSRLSLRMVGDQLVGNGASPIAVHAPSRLELYRLTLLAPPKAQGVALGGLLGERQAEIMDILLRQQRAVRIEPVGSRAGE